MSPPQTCRPAQWSVRTPRSGEAGLHHLALDRQIIEVGGGFLSDADAPFDHLGRDRRDVTRSQQDMGRLRIHLQSLPHPRQRVGHGAALVRQVGDRFGRRQAALRAHADEDHAFDAGRAGQRVQDPLRHRFPGDVEQRFGAAPRLRVERVVRIGHRAAHQQGLHGAQDLPRRLRKNTPPASPPPPARRFVTRAHAGAGGGVRGGGWTAVTVFPQSAKWVGGRRPIGAGPSRISSSQYLPAARSGSPLARAPLSARRRRIPAAG